MLDPMSTDRGGIPPIAALGLEALLESFPAAVCVVDSGGEVVAHNRVFRNYAGQSRRAAGVVGWRVDEIIPSADRERIAAAFRHVHETSAASLLTDGVWSPTDVPPTWDGCVAPVHDGQARVAYNLLVLWDQSPRLAAEREANELAARLTAANERLAITALEARDLAESAEAARLEVQRAAAELDGVFAAMRDIVLVYTPEGRVAKANPAAIAAFGFDPTGLDATALAARVSISDVGGTPITPARLPAVTALHKEEPSREPMVFEGSDGRRHIVEPVAASLNGHTGTFGAVSVWHDVTHREELLEALQDKTEALTEADQRKDEFLAMLAHELRNPLAPIRNAAEILRLRSSDNPDLRWVEEVIQRQVRHMARLLDDLLEVSRITTGKVMLAKEYVELATIVASAVEASRPFIDAQEQQLQVSLPAEPVYLIADPTRLVQVIDNLVNNAAKYSETAGRIWLEVEAAESDVAIRVRDSGVGIAAEQLPHVFDLFMQADRSLDRSHGGLGVGLTVVRSLVEMHGGTVEAFSVGRGQGSEFVIRLPRAAPAPAATEVAASAAPTLAPRRVLVIDDNIDAADSLVYLLEAFGHEVHGVHAAGAGLEEAKRFAPDVVLLDIGLPGMNGYEVAKALRRQPECAGALIVALTGYGQEEDRGRSLTAGFDAHLVKPVDIDTLLEIIARRADIQS
jgi:signal transduction histidine kinase/ActR/RegA family two-component response regulator